MGNACTQRAEDKEEVDGVRVRKTITLPFEANNNNVWRSEPHSETHSKNSSVTGKIKDSNKLERRLSKVSELVNSKLIDYVNQDDSFVEDFEHMHVHDDQDSVHLEYDEPDVEGRARQARQVVSTYIIENPDLITNPANIKIRWSK